MGIEVEIRPISVDELIKASKKGTLKEIFGAGTAVVILSITGFGYQNIDYKIKSIQDSYAEKLKKAITDIQYNISDDPHHWTVSI